MGGLLNCSRHFLSAGLKRGDFRQDEFFFPGSECLDGSIKGALKAGIRAYPIEDKSNPEGLFAELGQFFMCVFALNLVHRYSTIEPDD